MARFVRRELIDSASLREAIARAERGLIDADLGVDLSSSESLAKVKAVLQATARSLPIVELIVQYLSSGLRKASAETSHGMN